MTNYYINNKNISSYYYDNIYVSGGGNGNGGGYGYGREIIDTYSRWHLRKYEKIVPIEVVIYEVHR